MLLLERYRLLELIGQGGHATVYSAEDAVLGRRVAVKILASDRAAHPSSLRRFLAEARSAARMQHPHVVGIFDLGESEGTPFLVMEEMTRGSLQRMLDEQGAFEWRAATRVLIEACRGVAVAHQLGIVHRDIKPSNLLCSESGCVKVADFGLAITSDASLETTRGRVLGTPLYMSPEQCRGERGDEASDVYALGVTYFALLTGRAPYEHDSPMQVMFAHCSSPIPDPREYVATIPQACAAIAMRAMAKASRDRFATIDEMLAALLGANACDEDDATAGNEAYAGNEAAESVDVATAGASSVARGDSRWRIARRHVARFWQQGFVLLLVSLLVAIALVRWNEQVDAVWASAKARQSRADRGERPEGLRTAARIPLVALTNASFPPPLPASTPSPYVATWMTTGAASGRWQADGNVRTIAFSPDDRLIVSALSRGRTGARVWDATTGQEMQSPTISGPAGGATFSADGQSLAVLSGAGRLTFHDVSTGELRRELDLAALGRPQVISCQPYRTNLLVGFAPDSDECSLVALVNLATGRPVARFVLPKDSRPTGLVLADDGATGGVSTLDGRLLVLDGVRGEQRKLTGELDAAYSAAFSVGGRLVALGGAVANPQNRAEDAGRVLVFDLAAGTVVRQLEIARSVHSLAFAPHRDRARLALGTAAGEVEIWDLDEPRPQAIPFPTLQGVVRGIAVSPDGRGIAAGTSTGHLSAVRTVPVGPAEHASP